MADDEKPTLELESGLEGAPSTASVTPNNLVLECELPGTAEVEEREEGAKTPEDEDDEGKESNQLADQLAVEAPPPPQQEQEQGQEQEQEQEQVQVPEKQQQKQEVAPKGPEEGVVQPAPANNAAAHDAGDAAVVAVAATDEAAIDMRESINVIFEAEDGSTSELLCGMEQTVEEVTALYALNKDWRIGTFIFKLKSSGEVLEKETLLRECVHDATQCVTLLLERPVYEMPDQWTVRMDLSDGQMAEVKVKVERSDRPKPYLGGFRNKNTGQEYHHAASQTDPTKTKKKVEHKPKNHRETQTREVKNSRAQTVVNEGTQMPKDGHYVSSSGDKIIRPGKYVTAAEYHKIVTRAVVTIQSYMRGYLTRKYVKTLRYSRDQRRKWQEDMSMRRQKEAEEEMKRTLERHRHPRTRADFQLLYNGLEKWHAQEVAKINSVPMTKEQLQQRNLALVKQEARLRASIDQLKVQATVENKEEATVKLLNTMASPKKWMMSDGQVMEVHTPHTKRAAELNTIFHQLRMETPTMDERLDVLIHLKWTVKEFECRLTHDIVLLIDREANLLMRGCSNDSLSGLRRRISNLFLQFIENPEFNPEAARHVQIPKRKAESVYHSYVSFMKNSGAPKSNLNRYYASKMLQESQRAEYAKDNNSRAIFLLQEQDLVYLVESIWNKQSAISGAQKVEDLCLTRWDRMEEWTPWNCILLTREEREEFDTVAGGVSNFSGDFVRKVDHKHLVARTHFETLAKMLAQITEQEEAEALRLQEEQRIRAKELFPTDTPPSNKPNEAGVGDGPLALKDSAAVEAAEPLAIEMPPIAT